jgi:SAM-dependent methyltransferase
MESSFEAKHHQIEDYYWWFVARRDILISLIPKGEDSRILDVGCAGGHLIKALRIEGFRKVYGIDISKKSIFSCRKNGLGKIMLSDASQTGFRSEIFDVVVASDVLEHIKDDAKALREWGRIMKKGGRIVVFVPAFSFLWSAHDVVCHHHRRYSFSSMTRALEGSGFVIERVSGWNMISFLPSAFVRMLDSLLSRSGIIRVIRGDQLYRVNPSINWMLLTALKAENRLIKRSSMPFGVSMFAVARKA